MKTKTVLNLVADKESVKTVMTALEKEISEKDISFKDENALTLSLEEAYVNIVDYAYESPPGKAKVIFEYDDETLTITLIDKGRSFNPLQKEGPDITLPAEQREVGGLGIFLVKKMMDEVTYQRSKGRNILVMKRKVKKGENK